jgi:hypothetical protein
LIKFGITIWFPTSNPQINVKCTISIRKWS